MRATGFFEEVYNNTSELIVQDTMTNLGSLESVLEDVRSSNQRGDARNEHILHLADFGDQTWPGGPVMAVKASFPELRNAARVGMASGGP
ncbi:MAG: hypothetical protein ACKPKO_63730, partial [Candidatus Fonsibacter sp.]